MFLKIFDNSKFLPIQIRQELLLRIEFTCYGFKYLMFNGEVLCFPLYLNSTVINDHVEWPLPQLQCRGSLADSRDCCAHVGPGYCE